MVQVMRYSISSFSGQVIPWTTEIRYLGVYIVCSWIFKSYGTTQNCFQETTAH